LSENYLVLPLYYIHPVLRLMGPKNGEVKAVLHTFYSHIFSLAVALGLCKPAYSESVPKPRNSGIVAGWASDVKQPCGAWLGLL